MGVDIGDLSAVLLASVPPSAASYVQRVGRAGRLTGNSLVTTFARADQRGLYYLAQPEYLIAGAVRPPSCFLDARELLQRQYFAFLLDRVADGSISAPVLPDQIGRLIHTGLKPDGFLRAVLDANALRPDLVEKFLRLFDGHIHGETADSLRDFARIGLDLQVKEAVDRWQNELHELELRRDRLKSAIDKLDMLPTRTEDEERDLRGLRGERQAIIQRMREQRERYTLSALEAMGLLPNYTLLDDGVTLVASMWAQNDDGEFETTEATYTRGARLALTELAPGNSFYIEGHRHLIDGLDIGAASEPLYEQWRLCPECDFGALEIDNQPLQACPRCGSTGITDAATRHTMLRLRSVSALSSEDAARVNDDRDERDRRQYHTTVTVDVDPLDIVGTAWEHDTEAFGMELASRAVIRSFNLGPRDASGDTVIIGGEPCVASRFQTCQHCGVVTERSRSRNSQGEIGHRGWCQVRRGTRNEEWGYPILYHQIETEAVRLLLPVSTTDVEERLASFKAALLLGLELDFGGQPDHLAVITADYPNRAGLGRRRFLVLHDTVPGGTGYLGRVADPDRLHAILVRSREHISRCVCRGEGLAACHRCLLGQVPSREIDLVSRDIALELLDALLLDWKFHPVQSVASVDIAQVEESELERLFRSALRAWATASAATVTLSKAASRNRFEAFDLRITTAAGETLRYLIEEQIELSTAPPTRPDLLISRQDTAAPQIAIYLDGYQYHASPANARLGDDANKRGGVRAGKRLVWNLTWHDVTEFNTAYEASPPRTPPPRPLLTRQQRGIADAHRHGRAGRIDVSTLDQNPMQVLIEYLADPDLDAWEQVACSAVVGIVSRPPDGTAATTELSPVVGAFLESGPPPADTAGAVQLWRSESANGLALGVLLDTRPPFGVDDERWTVVGSVPDTPDRLAEPNHASRWRDWLQWANVVQFLRSPGRQAVITSTSLAASYDLGTIDVLPAPGAIASVVPDAGVATAHGVGASTLDAAAQEAVDLVLDEACRDLAKGAILAGCPVPDPGYEPEGAGGGHGWMVEVAWPEVRVAVLADLDDKRDAYLRGAGWKAEHHSVWTVDDLVAAIRERM
jgi:hypothetical protein